MGIRGIIYVTPRSSVDLERCPAKAKVVGSNPTVETHII